MTKKVSEPVGLIRNELEIPIEAPPSVVWTALVEDIDSWWQPDFYFTAEPRSIVLEAKIGGRMYEQSSDGSGLLWYNVIALSPGKTLTLAGYFAPPYAGPASTTLHLALEPRGDSRTLFQMTECVWGHMGENLKQSLETGWRQLFETGLKAHVESS